MDRRLKSMGAFLAVAVLAPALSCCDSGSPTGVEAGLTDVNPRFLIWDLLYCPECRREEPTETQATVIDDAFENHISETCLEAALQNDEAYDWLYEQVALGRIGIDWDVYNLKEYDYARGYWVLPSQRYQYWGYPIWLAQQITNEDEVLQVAVTLIHETAHEFGEEDDNIAESFGNLCSYN